MKQEFDFSDKIKADLIDFFLSKRSEILKDLKQIDQTLLSLREKEIVQEAKEKNIPIIEEKKIDNPIPWKFKIDDILQASKAPLSASEISSQIVSRDPHSHISKESLRKSISSALSLNSKTNNSRYIRKIVKGLSYYSINRDFEEFKK